MVLLDLSAAFDTVDHDALLDVIQKRLGVECCALDWFLVIIVKPDTIVLRYIWAVGSVSLPCSVPQGSRIGPHEFIVYTEDIAETIAAFQLNHHLYADDTQLQKILRIVDINTTRVNLELCVKLKTGPHQDGCSSMLTRPS